MLFDGDYFSESPCLPSRAAVSSEQFGIVNGMVGHFGRAKQFRLDPGHSSVLGIPLLGQRLQQHGWYTAAVSMVAKQHRDYWFYGDYRGVIRPSSELNDEQAHQINPLALDRIRRHRDQDNWFLHLHYGEPHIDYLVGPEWDDQAGATGAEQAWPDDVTIAEHGEQVYGHRLAVDLHYTR